MGEGGRTEVRASRKLRERRSGGEPLVPAEIVQDAAGNLQTFGLHGEDRQQAQCIPAPRSRHRRAAQRPGPTDTGTLRPDPEAGPRRGAEPWSHAPSARKGPMESGEARACARLANETFVYWSVGSNRSSCSSVPAPKINFPPPLTECTRVLSRMRVVCGFYYTVGSFELLF